MDLRNQNIVEYMKNTSDVAERLEMGPYDEHQSTQRDERGLSAELCFELGQGAVIATELCLNASLESL